MTSLEFRSRRLSQQHRRPDRTLCSNSPSYCCKDTAGMLGFQPLRMRKDTSSMTCCILAFHIHSTRIPDKRSIVPLCNSSAPPGTTRIGRAEKLVRDSRTRKVIASKAFARPEESAHLKANNSLLSSGKAIRLHLLNS
jgi:hypothetical protein